MRMNQWELPQYEHIWDNMDISVVLLLGWPTRDNIAVLWLDWVIDQVSRMVDQSAQIKRAGFFCLHYCVRPLYSSRMPLSLIGGKWGESRSQHTLEYIWYTHQQEGEHGSWNSFSLTKWTLQRRFRSATTTTKKKSTMVEADTKPASSLSNGIDNVPQDFHLNTFLTHRKKK